MVIQNILSDENVETRTYEMEGGSGSLLKPIWQAKNLETHGGLRTDVGTSVNHFVKHTKHVG